MGLQCPYRDCSYNICIRVPRSVSLVSYYSFVNFNLASWITTGATPLYVVQHQLLTSIWTCILNVAGIAMSMIANALVMGLIVFRIFKVFREVKSTSDDQILGATGGNTLQSMIFILIESGMALFSIQLVRLVLDILQNWPGSMATLNPYPLITGIHEMINVIIRSDISAFYFVDNVGYTRV